MFLPGTSCLHHPILRASKEAIFPLVCRNVENIATLKCDTLADIMYVKNNMEVHIQRTNLALAKFKDQVEQTVSLMRTAYNNQLAKVNKLIDGKVVSCDQDAAFNHLQQQSRLKLLKTLVQLNEVELGEQVHIMEDSIKECFEELEDQMRKHL